MLYHEIPSWQQDNEFLLSGYRDLYMHNETVNIVSHTLGCITFATIPFFLYYMYHPTRSRYCFGVAFCFACSSIRSWARACNRLDYMGIVVLVWSANAPIVRYGLSGLPDLQRFYGLIVTCFISRFIFGHNFGFSAFRKWRVLVYSISGLGSLASLLYGLQIKGWAVLGNYLSLRWLACTTLLNLMAATVYASRIPERWFPYRFDLVGASYQIFHLLVLIATFTHLAGLLAASQHAAL
ncbi:hemolysin-III related-domain-containing protein [Microdochium trichocladiopsis]|uniref:Hemolysin-III related-domain-containing protein n=1 Tax=Microdochium trichocladiopsis TaxID=1682393 RepID=A0A9P8XPH6_9PEZI|nr:hemolysin-III related-domain-containing protein [Microdochium trichocladiopsis]KAH7009288.1 hemolysin-III related-domain-containing protein [Microdochium trichocladiopsis]